VIRLLGLAISIGVADSLNPSTIAPALYLAAGRHPRRRVAEFTAGVFVVYTLGGMAVALGPGELLLSLVPHPGRQLGFWVETIAGVLMLVASGVLWLRRRQLAGRLTPSFTPRSRRSSAVLGATITAVELPTAFPYFAVIAAMIGAGLGPPRVVFLLLVFNVCFIAPLLGILATLTVGGPDAQAQLARGRRRLEANWPKVLAALALVAGLVITLLGVTGLGAAHRNDFGTLSRHIRKLLHLQP